MDLKPIDVLKELVRLKDYKDKYGEDEHYVVEQPLVWNKARYVLKKACEGKSIADTESKCNKHIVNCFKTDGEQLIKTLGFELDHQYNHDHFHTNRYRKGLLMVEFTYEGFTLKTIDLTIDEVFCKPITYAELKAITPVLGEMQA